MCLVAVCVAPACSQVEMVIIRENMVSFLKSYCGDESEQIGNQLLELPVQNVCPGQLKALQLSLKVETMKASLKQQQLFMTLHWLFDECNNNPLGGLIAALSSQH